MRLRSSLHGCLLFVVTVFGHSNAVLAEDQPPPLGLPDVVGKIREYWRPQLASGVIDASALESIAKTSLYPSFTMTSSQSYGPLNSMPAQIQRSSQLLLVGHVIQPSNWAQISAAQSGTKAAQLGVEGQLFTLAQNGIQTFYAYLETQKESELQDRQIDRLKRTVDFLKEATKVVLNDEADLLAAEAELKAAEFQKNVLKSNLELASRDLRIAMGMNESEPVTLNADLPDAGSSKTLLTMDWGPVLDRHPALRSLQEQQNSYSYQYRAYGYSWLPNLDANLGYSRNGALSPFGNTGSAPNELSAGITLTWSIFDQGVRIANASQSNAHRNLAESQRFDQKRQFADTVTWLKNSYSLQSEAVKLNDARLDLANQSYEAAWTLFSIGKKSFTSLQVTEDLLISTELDSARTRIQLASTISTLKLWGGEL